MPVAYDQPQRLPESRQNQDRIRHLAAEDHRRPVADDDDAEEIEDCAPQGYRAAPINVVNTVMGSHTHHWIAKVRSSRHPHTHIHGNYVFTSSSREVAVATPPWASFHVNTRSPLSVATA